jgi:hypothetical protein
MTKSQASALRRKQAIKRSRVSDSQIPDLAKTVIRKGKAPQRVGMWGTLDMHYKTPTLSTHDSRYDHTLSNLP